MALVALTNGDLVKFVSDRDPAKTKNKVPNDPGDPTKGEKEIEVIDYEKATVFYVRPLDVFLMGAIYDGATALSGRQGQEEIGIHTKVNETNIEAVRFGLSRWDNFSDINGKLVNLKTEEVVRNKTKYQAVSDASLNFMGIQLISEVANKIKAISEVSQAEAKNSA